MQTGTALVLVLVTAALGGIITLRALRLLRRLRGRRRQRRALAAEAATPRLLADAGYRVIVAQPEGRGELLVDGDAVEYGVRADYLATRGGRTWAVEVKTGGEAPRLESRATRRQLLEYAVTYDVEGALLVEPEANRVREVRWELSRPRRLLGEGPIAWLLAGLVAGLLLGSTLAGFGE